MNVFTRFKSMLLGSNRDPTSDGYRAPNSLGYYYNGTPNFSGWSEPDIVSFPQNVSKTILGSVITRIAVDVSQFTFKHVLLDDKDRYKSTIQSGLTKCLTLSSNIDQTCDHFIRNAILVMLCEGSVGIVETTADTDVPTSESVTSMRCGSIVQNGARTVKVSLYNDLTGQREEIVLPKTSVAIPENPFYHIMNAPNSTMQDLTKVLKTMNVQDSRQQSDKMNMGIRIPYPMNSNIGRKRVTERSNEIEQNLNQSKHGIFFYGPEEVLTPLNRPIDTTLLARIEFLTKQVLSEMGFSIEILNGTASSTALQAYQTRILQPCANALANSMKCTFLTEEQLLQKRESIMYFKDPFAMMPVEMVAEMSDKMTRNEIMSPNEVRQGIGMVPADDPKADELRNRNLNESNENLRPSIKKEEETKHE